MSDSLIETGKAQAHYSASGTRVLRYSLEMFHRGLNEHKVISASEIDILKNKASLQVLKWEEKWQVVSARQKHEAEKEANTGEANARTEAAQAALEEIDNLLVHTLSIDDTVDWNSLKKTSRFPVKTPAKPEKKSYAAYPSKPDPDSIEYTATLSFFDKLIASRKQSKIQQCEQLYAAAVSEWEKQKSTIDAANAKIDKEYECELEQWKKVVAEWESCKAAFLQEQQAYNAKIDEMKNLYLSRNPDSIVEYCEMVLNNSTYPEVFPKAFELEYNPENKILIVEYTLPPLECFPTLKEVRYVPARKELKESHISESQLNKMFDEAMYKIALRTIHELFEADCADALAAVSFNGWVKSINKATGKEENNCIVSIQAKKAEFLQIDLANVDPKICFKNLKGVAASKLSALMPVQPILQMSKTDKRFVEGYNVADDLDTSTNLAAMDWEDFEHLIRELFEKEFKTGGGEVKITQASRDGGVDAVAFDPDPIRGGKIVIQAKRYTNTVGVSAVRDLFGTVHNEGAIKGILVSTADYGPDAYEFAKGKPLTLLNGSNLLHLLEKHGHHAKIDLREARKILAEKDKQ